MKRLVFILAGLVFGAGVASAQSYIVVDSEKVFKSIAAYNNAVQTLETDAATYQKQLDDQFAAIEKAFNDYQAKKAAMSAAQRQAAEQNIVSSEDKANKFQQEVFGENGTLAKKRETLLKPIQDKVTTAIQNYAKSKGVTIVLDVSSNPMVLYYNPSADRTNDIINLVK